MMFGKGSLRIVLLGALIMTGCATTYRAGAPAGAIDVIAHRGASAYAPENTLASFALAKDLGADWFELDCTLTKDDQVIVIHDDTVDRTTDGKGEVASFSLEELRKLDAGSWKDPKFTGERLPTLAEALDLAKARQIGVYIEIKNSDDDNGTMGKVSEMAGARETLTPEMKRKMMALIRASGSRNLELARKVIDLVREQRMKRQVVIQSFSPIICAIVLSEAPELRTELLASKDEKKPERWPLVLRWASFVDPRGFNVYEMTLDPELLATWHHRGKTMAIWTVDDEADMRRLAQWGVDSIITDKPDVCLQVLTEAGKR